MKKTIKLMSLISWLFTSSILWAQTTQPHEVFVNFLWEGASLGADPDGAGPATQMGYDGFASINEALNQVALGGVVHIAAGTYTEQLEISQNVILQGSGADTIIESPDLLSLSFNTGISNKPIIWVHDVTDARILSLVVDGLGNGNDNSRFMGIAFQNAGGLIDQVEIRNIRNTPMDGSQQGIGIYVRNLTAFDRVITISRSNIHDYQKNGMAIVGQHLTATITDNTVTGSGPTPILAQNGIQLSYGAVGTIQGNTIRANDCTSESGNCTLDPALSIDADTAAGILIFSPGSSSLDISGNTLENNQCNLCALSYSFYSSSASMTIDIHDNTLNSGELGVGFFDPDGSVSVAGLLTQNSILNHRYGLFVRDDEMTSGNMSIVAHLNRMVGNLSDGAWSNTPVNAESNWWGCLEGSALVPGICDAHTALVDTEPWLTTSDISGTTTGGTSGSTTAGSVTAGTSSAGSTSSGSAGISGGASGGSSAGTSGGTTVPPDTISYTGSFPATSTGWYTVRLTVGGIARNVRVYRPNTNPNLPLLFMFSGTGGNPIDGFLQEFGNYRPDYENVIATTLNTYEPAIMVFPEPRDLPDGDWDRLYGAPYWETTGQADDINVNLDLLLVRAIIQESRNAYQINPQRVYSMGFSSGAFFSSLVGTRLSDRVAAFSEQSGGWAKCPPKRTWIPSSHSTSWAALVTQGNAAIPGFNSCSTGSAEPFTTLSSGRRLQAYLRHGNADDVVSVYYTAAMADLMRANGQTITDYAPGLDYSNPATEVVVEIVDGKGHDVSVGYLDRAWPFLRSKTLSGSISGGSTTASGTAGVSTTAGTSTGGTVTGGVSGGTGGTTSAGSAGTTAGVSTTAGTSTGGTVTGGVSGGSAGTTSAGSGGTTSGGTTAGTSTGGTTGGTTTSGFISRGLPIPADDTISYSGIFADSTGWLTPSITVNGMTRILHNSDRLRVYRPTSRRANLPLVLIFPGTGSTTLDFFDELGGPGGLVNSFGSDEVIIAVLPHAYQSSGDWDHPWDAEYWNTTIDNANTNPDLAYVRAVIQESRRAYGINPARVYTMGHSSGAFFAEFSAELLGDRIAGFAENAGGLVGCLANNGNKAPDPQYQSSSTNCDTILTNISSFAGRNNYTCSSRWEPFPSFFPGNPIPAYINHANNDDTVSVYHSCFLRQQLLNSGSVEGQNLWVTIRNDRSGHSVGSGFIQTAWGYLKNRSL